MLNDSIKRLNKELGECYFYSMQGLYGGMYRVFNVPQKGLVEVNRPEMDGSVSNDISKLPRARVVVTESPNGVTRRINNRITAFEGLQMGNPDDLTTNILYEEIFSTMDNMTESKKAEISANMAEQRELIKLTQKANAANAQLTIMQAEMMAQQMQNPQPQAPVEGGGEEQALPQEQPQ